MNFGTKVRTIARIIASLNTATYAVSAAVAGLGFGWLTIAWTILTIALDFFVAFFTTYYNNDYTGEGSVGTKVTREMKELADTEWIPADEPDDADLEVVEDDNR